jgi:hypothetical protein
MSFLPCDEQVLARTATFFEIELSEILGDVVRATTTATTAVAAGRRCFTVPTLEAALNLAARPEKRFAGRRTRRYYAAGFPSQQQSG